MGPDSDRIANINLYNVISDGKVNSAIKERKCFQCLRPGDELSGGQKRSIFNPFFNISDL